MSGILFSSNDKTDEEILNQLSKSWFSRTHSMAAMISGANNEAVVLKTFSKLRYLKSIFEIGLKNKMYPWTVESPASIVVVGSDEMKTLWHQLKLKLELPQRERERE
jgi:hypothetical protein